MDPDQGKRVIEGSHPPRSGLVTCVAIGGETGRLVVWVGGGVVVVAMAIDALRGEAGIDAAGVTSAAWLGGVRADQRPHRVRVVCSKPIRVGLSVTGVAVGGKTGRRVIWVVGGVVVVEVATDAIGGRTGVDTTRVAIRAVECGVDPDQ